MRFKVAGKEYEISFHRERRMGERWDPKKQEFVQVPTSHPYTTAYIHVVGADGKRGDVFRTATVGCYHKEKRFDPNMGRTQALRLITKTVDIDFYTAMWERYSNRWPKKK